MYFLSGVEIKTIIIIIIIIIIKKERQDWFGILLCLEAQLLPRLCLIYSLESSTFTSLQTFNSSRYVTSRDFCRKDHWL